MTILFKCEKRLSLASIEARLDAGIKFMGYYTLYSLTWKRLDETAVSPPGSARVCLHTQCELFNGRFDPANNFCPSCGNSLGSSNSAAQLDAKVACLIADDEEATFCLSPDGSCNGEGKWYDNEKTLKHFSSQLPGVLLTLHCLGEDGKQWRVYACNGQVQRVNAVITFPDPPAEFLRKSPKGK